jgi:mono/diheme cytochrome c family protein
MKTSRVVLAILAAALAWPAAAAQPAKKWDFGKSEFDSNCASCHGLQGEGNGPYSPYLNTITPNLATLSKRNGGVFPASKVLASIDGSEMPKRHGTSDMPIWGREYRSRAGEAYFDVPYDPEAYVRTRLLVLTDYVARLQK